MDAELVTWTLLVVGMLLSLVLAVGVRGHLRRLDRERATAKADIDRRVARLQLLAAGRMRTRRVS